MFQNGQAGGCRPAFLEFKKKGVRTNGLFLHEGTCLQKKRKKKVPGEVHENII